MATDKAKKKWPEEEEKKLMAEIQDGKSIQEIAIIHQRTDNAIAMRLCDIGKRMSENTNKTMIDIQKILKLVSVNEIEKYIKNENAKHAKKEKKEPEKTPKKEETIESVKSKLNELQTKYDLLDEKYNKIKSIDDKFNELNKKMDNLLELFTKKDGKKIKVKKTSN